MRIASTETLEYIASEKFPNLDPQGCHVCIFSLLHNGTQIRSGWYVKVIGMDDPVEVEITCPLEDWNKIPYHETNKN